VILAMVLFLPLPGACIEQSELIEKVGYGRINWTEGYVQVTGTGIPTAEYLGIPQPQASTLMKARLNALDRTLDLLKSVRIDPNRTVNDLVAQNAAILQEMALLVEQAQIVKQKFISDGSVELTTRFSIYGDFARLVLPAEIEEIEAIRPVAPEVKKTDHPLRESGHERLPHKSSIYSGLIVDARGLGAKPAMIIRIFGDGGQEVYGPAFVSREFVVRWGMCGYLKSLAVARKHQRVAGNPLTVKALRRKEVNPDRMVISNVDAFKIRSASEHLMFLKKCQVIVVVD
jgi:hypothetical protein